MLVRQFFDSALTDEWTPSSTAIFYNLPFSVRNPSRTQRVWIRNDSSINFSRVVLSASPITTPILPATEVKTWVKFGLTSNDIDEDELEISLNSGQTKSYYIKITIPADILNNASLINIFPVLTLNFRARVVVDDVSTDIVYTGQNGFDHPDSNFYRTRLDAENGLVLSDSPLSGSWSRTLNMTGVAPFRITELQVTGSEPNNTEIVTFIRRSDNPTDIVTQPIIDVPQSTALGDADLSLGFVQVVVSLRDSPSLQGDTPRVTQVEFTALSDSSTSYIFPSHLQFDALGELPDGVLALDQNNQVCAVLNNVLAELSFGYARIGGNADFTLSLRWDWDHELPFAYDHSIVYVKDKQVYYRGVIDKIHTKLIESKESIVVSGAGLSKQLGSILVNQRFNHVSIKKMITTLLDKHLSDSKSPAIFYRSIDIENISTTAVLNFRNETLFDAITKIANFAGANPSNEGSDGNDIIWGVNEQSHFYFKRKSTDLQYNFHVGDDISIDDSRVAPRFNRLTLTGYTEGGNLENYILDGDCEKTSGSHDIDNFNLFWLVSDNIDVRAVTGSNDVVHGSQAYQFPISHTDATNYRTTFRILPIDLPRDKSYMLSFYAKSSSNNVTTLRVGILLDYETDDADVRNSDVIRRFTLGSSFAKYVAGPFTTPNISIRNNFGGTTNLNYLPVTVYFAVDETDPDEEVTLDAIFLHEGTSPIPTNHYVTQDNHVYGVDVFSSDQRYDVIVSDWTEIARFGRIKESIREVDTIDGFEEAYNYARASLGGNSTETHRAILTVHNSMSLYRPYENNDVQWGYAKVFGSVNVDTQYEYSVISAKHTLRNERFNTKLELGAPRPTITEVMRALTARERFKGEGADTTNRTSGSSGGGGGGGGVVQSEVAVVQASAVTRRQALSLISDWAEQGNTDRIPATKMPAVVSQAEAEAGVSASTRSWTARRVRQAIESLGATLTTINDRIAAGVLSWARFGTNERIPASNLPEVVPRSEAETGIATTVRSWTAERVKQAIDLLARNVISDWAESDNFDRIPTSKMPAVVSQSEAEAGTATIIRSWTAERVKQATSESISSTLSVPSWSSVPTQSLAYNSSINLDLNTYVSSALSITITASGLPSGLSISNGIISGTTTDVGSHTITATATNTIGSSTEQFTIQVLGITPSWSTIPASTVDYNTAFSLNLHTYLSGAPTPTVTASGLPSGLSISNGIISGTTTDVGDHTITATATNSVGTAQTTFTITVSEATLRFYMLDDAGNTMRLFNQDGTEDISGRIELGSGDWEGVVGDSFTIYLVDDGSNEYRVWDPRTGTETTEDLTSLPSGTWEAVTVIDGFEYFLDDGSNRLVTFSIDQNEDGEFEATEDTDNRINLGLGTWRGMFSTASDSRAVYLIDTRGSPDRLREWDVQGDEEYTDGPPYDLPSGTWTGGFWYDSKIHLIDDGNNRIRVFDFPDGVAAITEDTDSAISLPAGRWRAGYVYNG